MNTQADHMTVAHYTDDNVAVYCGDCLDILPGLAPQSVDAVVTDPPYALSFMGKDWDSAHPNPAVWKQCWRVLKPGGHLLSFGGTRTWHRLTVNIEDAGFEIRDSIAWLYGSGFPKSLDIHKAMDALKWSGRVCVMCDGTGEDRIPGRVCRCCNGHGREPYTDEWQGWGTALKPAHEPIVVARKPLQGNVAQNVLEHGTGALNIDGCRVEYSSTADYEQHKRTAEQTAKTGGIGKDSWKNSSDLSGVHPAHSAGRWPPNVVLDDEQAAELNHQSGIRPAGAFPGKQNAQPGGASGTMNSGWSGNVSPARKMGDSGGASRFFPVFKYTAKASGAERPTADGVTHPTVKPLELMRWLIRLVTPPHGLTLDPFAGSGTTGEAAIHEHMRCVLIERKADYLPVIVARLRKPIQVGFDFGD